MHAKSICTYTIGMERFTMTFFINMKKKIGIKSKK